MILIHVAGRPQGKARPKFAKGRAYTPKQTVDYENLIRWSYKQQSGVFHEGNVRVEVRAVFKIPKSWSNKKKQYYLQERIQPTNKPDIDNIIKAVLDALNGIAYKDDSCVVEVYGDKVYNLQNECLLIRIGEAHNGDETEITETKSTS